VQPPFTRYQGKHGIEIKTNHVPKRASRDQRKQRIRNDSSAASARITRSAARRVTAVNFSEIICIRLTTLSPPCEKCKSVIILCRNFEYEAGDYSRRVRFVMAHDPNQLVLHVAGYGELNIKPESGSGGLLGSSSSLAPPGGSPGLMRSKSDHRLASQYRQQEEERLARNRYVPEYE